MEWYPGPPSRTVNSENGWRDFLDGLGWEGAVRPGGRRNDVVQDSRVSSRSEVVE